MKLFKMVFNCKEYLIFKKQVFNLDFVGFKNTFKITQIIG